MKKITLLLLLTLSVLGVQAQTYQLNYDSIRVGKTAGTGGTSLYGKVYLKNVGLGLVSDSILTVLNGRIRKIPTISQFWQRSGTTLSPTTSGDNVSIAVSNANGLIVTNNSATEAAISSRNNGSGNIHQFLNTTGSISAINNNGLLQTATGTDSEFLRSNGTVLGSTGTGNVVRATSPTLVTPVLGNATGGTLSLSGMLTSTQGNNTQIFSSATATTGYQFGRMTNTSGGLLWGIEGSAAGILLAGGSAYAGVLTTTTTKNLELGTDQTLGIKIDGTNRKITMPELGGAGDVIVGANNTGLLGEIAIGSGLSLTAGVLTATGGSSGSVTTAGGTAGKIAKFTSASNIENSIMTESSGLIDVTGDLTANIVTADVGHKYNFGAANRGGIYGYSTLSGSGTDYTPTYYSESGLGANFYVDGGLTKGFTIATTGDATFSGSISSPDDIPFILSSPTTIDFHQSGSGTVRFVNNAFSAVNMSITNAGDVGVRGALAVTGAASASNLSGTNTGDQTTITGNAGTATALQTARNIQGVSFNGTTDINPINGTGFVKASGTTLSYDNTTYAPLASPALTGNPTAPTQTAGDNSTKIATTAYVDKFNLASGTYTPTLTNVANVGSWTVYQAQYMRVGNTVTVSGEILIGATAGSTDTTFRLTLPISSDIINANNAGGTGAIAESVINPVHIQGNAANNAAYFTYKSVGTSNYSLTYSYTYLIQ